MVIFQTYSNIPGQFPDIFVDIFQIFIFYRDNFSIENKGKMDFKIQIVFEAGLIHASENLHQRLEIRRLVFYYREEI